MAPDNVNVPLPSFVTVPDVVWIMFATETSPAPPNVIAKVSPEIVAPDNANVAIQGELEIVVPGVAMENTSLASESTYFTVSITDRAGNKSNQISTDNITVFP